MIPAALALALLALQTPQDHAPTQPVGPEAVPASATDLTDRERALAMSFGRPPTPAASPTNAAADDARAATLGRALFFDARLSSDGSFSCATCHDPDLGWSDGRPTPRARSPLRVNTPSVLGAAANLWHFWNGRADSLWAQAAEPIESPLEMDGSRMEVARLLASDSDLRAGFEAVFGPLPDLSDASRFPPRARPWPVRPDDPFGGPTERDLEDPAISAWAAMAKEDRAIVDRVFAGGLKAIAAFERGLMPPASPFDRFAAGLREGDTEATASLDTEALHGWRLFVGRANCAACHFGPTFSDLRFHNLGLPALDEEPAREGRPEGVRRVRINPLNGRGVLSDARDWDANAKLLYMVSGDHVLGAFKTPSLRNLAHTAPYGHDGRFADLGAVVDFYSDLPGEPAIGHREETLQPLNLTSVERAALVALLRSLSGPAVGPDGQSLSSR